MGMYYLLNTGLFSLLLNCKSTLMRNFRNIDVNAFENWLKSMGAEILPKTNDYEAIRFKGKQTGVLYKSGKVSNPYTEDAIKAFTCGKKWSGRPIRTGRHNTYRKQKEQLIERDGTRCFFCGQELGEDITVEHLISLSSGGKNTLSNMVLAHEKCNQSVGNMPIYQKVNMAIKNRLKSITMTPAQEQYYYEYYYTQEQALAAEQVSDIEYYFGS